MRITNLISRVCSYLQDCVEVDLKPDLGSVLVQCERQCVGCDCWMNVFAPSLKIWVGENPLWWYTHLTECWNRHHLYIQNPFTSMPSNLNLITGTKASSTAWKKKYIMFKAIWQAKSKVQQDRQMIAIIYIKKIYCGLATLVVMPQPPSHLQYQRRLQSGLLPFDTIALQFFLHCHPLAHCSIKYEIPCFFKLYEYYPENVLFFLTSPVGLWSLRAVWALQRMSRRSLSSPRVAAIHTRHQYPPLQHKHAHTKLSYTSDSTQQVSHADMHVFSLSIRIGHYL